LLVDGRILRIQSLRPKPYVFYGSGSGSVTGTLPKRVENKAKESRPRKASIISLCDWCASADGSWRMGDLALVMRPSMCEIVL
jgi:hypothetical protein